MIAAIALLFATSFPSTSQTAWMRPDAFRLVIGMSRAEAMKTLNDDGWKTHLAKSEEEVAFDYNDASGVTLQFRKNRLIAVRFELFAFQNQASAAFAEKKSLLHESFGEPTTTTKALVVYNRQLPNVMVVLSPAPRQGLWLLAVRYYDPVTK